MCFGDDCDYKHNKEGRCQGGRCVIVDDPGTCTTLMECDVNQFCEDNQCVPAKQLGEECTSFW